MAGKKLKYSDVGENYEKKDPIKKLAQKEAFLTSKNIHPFKEFSPSRGESAYVWKQGNTFMASVIEGLGTKNLIADEMEKLTGKNYYENIAHDTVAGIINDLITVGARPIAVHAFWAIGDISWLSNNKRITNLIKGWRKACDISLASWGGGESPTLREIIDEKAIILGGSAAGIIGDKKRLILENNLKAGDAIILIKSNGPNANGSSLIRAAAKKLPKSYLTKLSNGIFFGEEILKKSNIYAKLIKDLLDEGVDIHYVANITGHGFRKVMRATREFTYVIEKIFEPQEMFNLVQSVTGLRDKEMYGTFNMGMDYAIFIPEKHVQKTLKMITNNKFKGIHAGYVMKGEKKVIIKPKSIIFHSNELNLR